MKRNFLLNLNYNRLGSVPRTGLRMCTRHRSNSAVPSTDAVNISLKLGILFIFNFFFFFSYKLDDKYNAKFSRSETAAATRKGPNN